MGLLRVYSRYHPRSHIYRYIRTKIECLHVAHKYKKYEDADAVKCRAMKTNEEKLLQRGGCYSRRHRGIFRLLPTKARQIALLSCQNVS